MWQEVAISKFPSTAPSSQISNLETQVAHQPLLSRMAAVHISISKTVQVIVSIATFVVSAQNTEQA